MQILSLTKEKATELEEEVKNLRLQIEQLVNTHQKTMYLRDIEVFIHNNNKNNNNKRQRQEEINSNKKTKL